LIALLAHLTAAAELTATLTQKEGTRFIFSVSSDSRAEVLTWGSPLEAEPFGAILFDLLQNGESSTCSYSGPVYRYAFPAPLSAFVTILPEEPIFVEFDLANYFICSPGETYQVVMKLAEHALQGIILPHNVHLVVENTVSITWPAESRPKFAQSHLEVSASAANKFTNCNSGEQGNINVAVPAAITQSKNGGTCMNRGQSSCTLATTWFGACSAADFNFVKTTLANVQNRLTSFGINAYCNPSGCKAGVYAYVYPTDATYTVYLCSVFWSQPSERAETIVHEESHFKTLGGTNDYAYGQPACKNLAKTNTFQATHNADNVCYFAASA